MKVEVNKALDLVRGAVTVTSYFLPASDKHKSGIHVLSYRPSAVPRRNLQMLIIPL